MKTSAMKTSQTIRIIAAVISFLLPAAAFAQVGPTVSIPASNLITLSSANDYSFSAVGQKIGIVRTGTTTVNFTGTINFRNNDTLYIGDGVHFAPEFINGFSSGCMIINAGTARLDDCAFTGGQIDNYSNMTAGYFGVTNFTLNNYAAFNLVNGCSLNASQINNFGTLTTGYLGMTGDASTIINNTNASMILTSSGRLSVTGSMLRNEGNLDVQSFFTTDAGTLLINKAHLQMAADFTAAGVVVNKGMLISGGKMNMGATAAFYNSCRVLAAQVNNAAAKAANYGFIQVTDNVYGALNNSGTLKNAGYIRTTQLFNNGVITNSVNDQYTGNTLQEGAIRIEGGADGLESLNKGSIAGGKICDASNAGYALDSNGAVMTATIMLIGAFDTATYQAAPVMPCNCAGINQVTTAHAAVQLNGTQYSAYNQLDWTFNTTPELVSAELQAATNEQDYTTLQTVNMNGVTTTAFSYQHNQPAAPVYYYRLKLTAADSTVSFSNVVRLGMPWAAGVEEHQQATAFSAQVAYYPNPFSDNIHIDITGVQNEDVRAVIYDLAGRTVSVTDFSAHTGANSFTVSALQQLTAGIYVLQLHTANSNQDFQAKLVKQ